MKHEFTDPDLIELDRIWPLGQQLVVPENGTIVVAGAYEGRYIHYLSEMFPMSGLFGYEPQVESFRAAKERLHGRKRIVLMPSGLGTAARRVPIGDYGTDGASTLKSHHTEQSGEILDAVVELSNVGGEIDLLLLNCEGSEWAILPYLMDEMMHHRIATMAIQFHPEYVSCERAVRVLVYLKEYYDSLYNDYPTWIYLKRRAA